MYAIELRDLETFAAVVREGGMHKASRLLNLSQPAVSKSIRALEDAVGLRLLERSARGISPTIYGEALMRRSKMVFDDLQGALLELAYLADPEAGEVRLGCMDTLAAGLVGAVVEEMGRSHPRMQIVCESGQASDLVSVFLRQKVVDFVVARPFPATLPPDVEGEPLFHDVLRVVTGPKHPILRRRRITLADLVHEHWVLSRNEAEPGSPVFKAFQDAGLDPPKRLVVSGSLNMRYHLLRAGRFITVVPHSLLPFEQHRVLRMLPITLPWHTPTMILTLRDRLLSPAAEVFLRMLREKARPLCSEKARVASS